MKVAIVQRARELGFDDCRFTTAEPPGSAAQFRHWLDQNRQGEMAYLERNAHKRVDPQKVLPGAKSIIVLAAGYSAEPPRSAEPTNGPRGIVARYACYRDYHDILGDRLKELVSFVNQLGG